jgi:CRISPR-associated protein Csx16
LTRKKQNDAGDKQMSIWFVSRHPGTIAWIKSQPVTVDIFCEHLDVNEINAGDVVIGNLPVPMGAAILEKGARYIYLSVALPSTLRGKELSESELNNLGVSLHEVNITLGERLSVADIS